MTKEQIKEYTARVAQANRTELVVIIYELLLDEIQEGNKQYQAGNTDAGEKQIRKAQGYLQELLEQYDCKRVLRDRNAARVRLHEGRAGAFPFSLLRLGFSQTASGT